MAGTSATTTTAITSTATTMRAMVAAPDVDDASVLSPRSRSEVKNTATKITIWTTKPETESITPAVIAVAGGTPKRWKNRTLMATRAAVLGMARLT